MEAEEQKSFSEKALPKNLGQKFFSAEELKAALQRQHYALFGQAAVKVCHYTKASIKGDKVCYKQQFYGIECHRCLQMTPCAAFCNQQCIFCWRPLAGHTLLAEKFAEPEEIVKRSFELQRKLLSGLGGIKHRLDLKKYEEAMQPTQVAISLSGEPTLYPKLAELIEAYHKQGCTTFVVSNSTRPEVLRKIKPTQLYLSLEAADEAMHLSINDPAPGSHWPAINQSLEFFPKLKTRKCIRLTCIKGVNMDRAKDFAALISKAKPDFVEVKAYMWVGFSRHRLKEENMPLHTEVRAFAEKLGKLLGYEVADEFKDSRVVLLWNGKTSLKIASPASNY